jgi:hypothetical protein
VDARDALQPVQLQYLRQSLPVKLFSHFTSNRSPDSLVLFIFYFFFFLKKRFRSSRATIRQLPAPALKLGVCQVNSDRVTASEHGAG